MVFCVQETLDLGRKEETQVDNGEEQWLALPLFPITRTELSWVRKQGEGASRLQLPFIHTSSKVHYHLEAL